MDMNFLFENLLVKESTEENIPIEFTFNIKKGEKVIGTCCLQLENFLENVEIGQDGKNKFFFKPNKIKTKNNLLRMTCEKCKDCGEFVPFDKIDEHQDLFHKDLRPFECLECGKVFRMLESLTIHQKVHEQKAHKCNECEKSYVHKRTLQSHVKKAHKGFNKFQCDECTKCYTEKYDLKRHIDAAHKGISPHCCKDCGKTFMRSDQLKHHQNVTHEGIRFNCEVCGKTFPRKDYLERHHMITHEGIVPFKCKECGKRLTTKAGLMRHRKSLHSKISSK